MTGAWLGLETTGSRGGAALVAPDGAVLAERVLDLQGSCSAVLLPTVAAVLEAAGLEGIRLGGIAVSTGPGSYTGLRIGIATAIGLSAGWRTGLKGVPTLRTLAWQSGSRHPVLAAVRARKGEVFAAVFRSADPFSDVLLEPGVYVAGSIAPLLDSLGVAAAAGNGIPEILPDRQACGSDLPSPSSVALLGMVMASAGGFDGAPEPLYLRGFREEAGTVGT